MKKLMLLAAVAVFGLSSVNAQEVKFGAKAGLNIANIGGDAEDTDALTSFHLGGVAEIVISEKFSVQPELLYSAQGYKSEESFEGITIESKLKLDYINIPIMAKYYVAEGFSVEAGPQVGFLLSANSENEGGGESEDVDVKDSTSGIDFGVGLGVGYKMDSGLNFSARYNLGLSNVYDGEGSDDYSIQNNVFQISVGYFFN
nr:porin family protein [uncultured Psychroserpens sp.]